MEAKLHTQNQTKKVFDIRSTDKLFDSFSILDVIVKFLGENISRKILDIKPSYMTDKNFR